MKSILQEGNLLCIFGNLNLPFTKYLESIVTSHFHSNLRNQLKKFQAKRLYTRIILAREKLIATLLIHLASKQKQ